MDETSVTSPAPSAPPVPGTASGPATDLPELPIRLDAGATAPSRAHPEDAGLDLVAAEDVRLAPGSRALVDTGTAVALPPGTVGLVCPRSGLAARHGVTVLNGPGIVDAGYRGTIKVTLLNTDAEHAVHLGAGDRIAQLVVVPFLATTPRVVERLDETDRAASGFGSSGGFGLHPPTTKGA